MSINAAEANQAFANGAAGGAGGVAGALAMKVVVDTALKIDRYNVENNPIERDAQGRFPRDSDDRPMHRLSPIELGLIYGGMAVSLISPPVGLAMGVVGVVLDVSRQIQDQRQHGGCVIS